jgi:hypothetical protein
MIRNLIFTAIFLSSAALILSGQGINESSGVPENSEKPAIDRLGYVRTSFYGGSRKYDFSSVFAEAGLKLTYAPDKAILKADLRLRSGKLYHEEFLKVEIKELYAGFRSKKADFTFGNQIVSWGRTDGFNPTNNITPFDYFFLSAEPDDQNLPNILGRLKFRLSQHAEMDIIGIPFYKPSVYRFDLFDLGDNVSFSEPAWPEKKLQNGTMAARLNMELPMAGFSFSWFRGFDPLIGFNIGSIHWSDNAPEISYVLTPCLKNGFGADFAIPAGSWLVKGEGSFNLIRHGGSQPAIPRTNLQYVIGMEKTLGGFHTIVQYIGQAVPDFSALKLPVLINPADQAELYRYSNDVVYYETEKFNRKIFYQQERTNHAVSLTVSKQFAYDIWKADLMAYYNITSEEVLLRLALGWNISDALSVKSGLYVMAGPEQSLFDYAGDVLNGAFLEIKVNF